MTELKRQDFVLKLSCPTGAGIVAPIAGFIADQGCYITEMDIHEDPQTELFFFRAAFDTRDATALDAGALKAGFQRCLDRAGLKADWRLHDVQQPVPTVIMVSHTDHCLLRLLYRQRMGDLGLDIRAIVSNHPDLEPIARGHGIPYHCWPITPDNKSEQEGKLRQLLEAEQVQLLILARYMQILSPGLCEELAGRVINIHHSFLPGFKGARPYEQAFQRGVKVFGATAHYVTTDLDEGPIIEQLVDRVENPKFSRDLSIVGRNMEAQTLVQAVQLHAQHRVFINGHRTIVFRGS